MHHLPDGISELLQLVSEHLLGLGVHLVVAFELLSAGHEQLAVHREALIRHAQVDLLHCVPLLLTAKLTRMRELVLIEVIAFCSDAGFRLSLRDYIVFLVSLIFVRYG